MRLIDADALIADCQLAQKQADRHGREFANAFYSGGGEVSTEWWCVEDMIENAPTIEPERKKGNKAAKRLSDLIFDINPAEICSQIESDNLRQWCKTIQTEMGMALIQMPEWGGNDDETD